MKIAWLALALVATSCSKPAPNRQSTPIAPGTDERAAVAQATLDVPALQQYFHVDTSPERVPVAVVVNDHVDASWPLAKFGQPVQWVDDTTIGERPHIVFTLLRIEGDKAGAMLRYPIEGVVLHAEFTRAGNAWTLKDFDLAEE